MSAGDASRTPTPRRPDRARTNAPDRVVVLVERSDGDDPADHDDTLAGGRRVLIASPDGVRPVRAFSAAPGAVLLCAKLPELGLIVHGEACPILEPAGGAR